MNVSAPYQELLPVVLAAARAASRAILTVYASDFTVEQKDDNSPLTLADRQSHRVISDVLGAAADTLPVLSEEGKDIPYETRRGWKKFWLVDPLDGTKEFVKRNGEFTVNIALIEDCRPVLGAIAVPVRDTLYFAIRGFGAYRLNTVSALTDGFGTDALLQNARKLPLAAARREDYVVAGSRSHGAGAFNDFVAGLEAKHGPVRLLAAGSALKFCLVAEGTADIYPRFGPTMEWDIAAGQIIVEEAGGTVAWADSGKPVSYNKPDLRNPAFLAMGNADALGGVS